MRKITVVDYTLRKLGEGGSSNLLFREKLAIAMGINRYGADVIELPAVKNAKEDRIIFRTIAQSVGTSVISIPVSIMVVDTSTSISPFTKSYMISSSSLSFI